MLSCKKILVPTDFGPSADEALRVGVEVAKMFGSELVVVHVWEIPAYAYSGMEFSAIDLLTPARDLAQRDLDAKLEELREQGVSALGLLRWGSAWSELRLAIEEVVPDLVVMGTHGRRGVARAVLGSVAEKTVRYSLSPVLTLRERESPSNSDIGASS